MQQAKGWASWPIFVEQTIAWLQCIWVHFTKDVIEVKWNRSSQEFDCVFDIIKAKSCSTENNADCGCWERYSVGGERGWPCYQPATQRHQGRQSWHLLQWSVHQGFQSNFVCMLCRERALLETKSVLFLENGIELRRCHSHHFSAKSICSTRWTTMQARPVLGTGRQCFV